MESNKISPPVINEVRPVGAWMYHATKQDGALVAFEQHLEAARLAGADMLEEYKHIVENLSADQLLDMTQPFCLEVALIKGSIEAPKQRKLAKKQKQLLMSFTDNADEKLPEFVAKLPKMLWSVRKTLMNKAVDYVAFYFEFSIKENSADLDLYRNALAAVKNGEVPINQPASPIIKLDKPMVTLD